MRPSLPVERKHFDLMCRLPVRTVETRREFDSSPHPAPPVRAYGRPRTQDLLELNRRIKRLKAWGYSFDEIRAITGAHPSTITRHLTDKISTLAKAKNIRSSQWK